jgi:hypothetical protein
MRGVRRHGPAGCLRVVAEQAVFAAPAAKKGWVIVVVGVWVIVVVGAAGKVASDHPSLGCKTVIMSDVDSAKQGRGYGLPCSTARMVQRDMKSGKLSVDAAWKQIEASLKPIETPPK